MTPLPPGPQSRSIRGDIASGLRWGTLNQLVQQVTRLAVQVVLTRLIAPESFGVLALAFVVVNFGALLTGLGFSQALIQRPTLRRGLVDAIFVGSALLGLLLAVAVAVAAQPLALLLGDGAVAPVLRVLALVFLFQGLEGVPNSLLRRELRFRPFVLSSTAAAVAGGAVGITLGLAGAGVWALVGFAVTEAVVATTLAWVFAISAGVWRPGVTWRLAPLKEVLGYSGAVTGTRVLFYGSRNIDNLIVGRVLGTAALGYYGLAYRLMLFPIQRVTDVVSSVTLPAFARVQHDEPRLQQGYLRAVRYLTAVIVPVTVGVALTAQHLVPVVFGAQWGPAVVPLQILAVSGPPLALVRLNGNLWEAIGRAGLSLAMSVIALVILIPAFLFGVRYGVDGVAVAYTTTAYVGLCPALVALRATTGIGLGRQLANVGPVAVATAAMVVLAVVAGQAVPDRVGHLGHLLAMVAAGGAGYCGGLWLTDRALVTEALAELRPGAA